MNLSIRRFVVGATVVVPILLSTACGGQSKSEITDRSVLTRFAPLPVAVPVKGGTPSDELVALGRMLYFDPRLSKGQDVSCNSCHPLTQYGADGKSTSMGYKGQRGDRNSPTVYNAAAQFVQFWDGRALDVEAQAKGPMLNPVEMAMPSGTAVVAVLKSMPGYVRAFRRAFPQDKNPVTFDHAAEAIGAFERQLVTPSRWDRFLHGDERALAADEIRGFNVFVESGCSTCHSGALLGGEAFQRLGLVAPYPDTSDPGRYKVTQKDPDRMVFKVAPLRNVARTAPYFHNGKVATLAEAVRQMGEYQLGRKIQKADADAIVTWLNVLTGDLPVNYTSPPDLPRSTARTPKPFSGD
jgi:cytochrome c peroxidase